MQILPLAIIRGNVFAKSLLPGLMIYLGCSALLVALSFVAIRYIRQPSPVSAGAVVYLAPVRNRTGNSLDNIGELIQSGLAQSAHINLLDQGRVGDLLQQMTKPPDTLN